MKPNQISNAIISSIVSYESGPFEENTDWKELKSSCIFFHLIEVTRKWSQDPEDIQHTTVHTTFESVEVPR
jgi:hypothetical protein